jgi:hypothetical protein
MRALFRARPGDHPAIARDREVWTHLGLHVRFDRSKRVDVNGTKPLAGCVEAPGMHRVQQGSRHPNAPVEICGGVVVGSAG